MKLYDIRVPGEAACDSAVPLKACTTRGAIALGLDDRSEALVLTSAGWTEIPRAEGERRYREGR